MLKNCKQCRKPHEVEAKLRGIALQQRTSLLAGGVMRKTLSCLGYSYKYLLEMKNLGAKELLKLLEKGTLRTTDWWIKRKKIKWEMKHV